MRNFSLKQKGFTLIELLVVISIIALLASVILGSLQSARDKAQTALMQNNIRQYRNALEQYYADNGKYPYPGPFLYYCLGHTPCIHNGGLYTEAPAIVNGLDPYIKGTPPLTTAPISMVINIFGGGSITLTYQSAIYSCETINGNPCAHAAIAWAVKSTTPNACAPGTAAYVGNEVSLCGLNFYDY